MIIDQLPSLNNTTNTDELPIERGTNTYKITFQNLFSTINSALSTAITDLQTLIADKVSKSGDTMTGTLTVQGGNLNVKSPELTDGTRVSALSWGRFFNFLDSLGAQIGILAPVFKTDGTQGIMLRIRRKINGTNTDNSVELDIDESGNRLVSLTHPLAWRSALGLGTSGALPITIAQGGTGQTAVSTETTVANVVTAETGVTIAGVAFCCWGKMAMIDLTIKLSTAVTTTADTKVATLKSGYKPKYYCSAITRTLGASYSYIEGENGTGGVHIYGTIPANTNIHILATYILA